MCCLLFPLLSTLLGLEVSAELLNVPQLSTVVAPRLNFVLLYLREVIVVSTLESASLLSVNVLSLWKMRSMTTSS